MTAHRDEAERNPNERHIERTSLKVPSELAIRVHICLRLFDIHHVFPAVPT